MTISFKGAHFPKDVILHAVFFYLRYGVSYRDLEEITAERGVDLDHATLNRWVSRYAGLIAEAARYRKRPAARWWTRPINRHLQTLVQIFAHGLAIRTYLARDGRNAQPGIAKLFRLSDPAMSR